MFLQKTGNDLRKNSQPDPYSMDKPSRYYLFLLTLTATLGGLLFGYDTAVISGTFGFVEVFFGLSKLEVGWFASSALVGAIMGAAIAGTLSDKYGRKPVLLVAAMLFLWPLGPE